MRARHPDTIFLAEAFTRPKMMARLAKLGFSQSYTYFTWRNAKWELTEYLTELTQSPLRDFFRPHFFVNTPDINPYFLHQAGAAFLIRAALATLLSGLWGMYSGFELCESAPFVLNGKVREEYLDSEKYQLRVRDWQQPGNIVAEISRLNEIRAGTRHCRTTWGCASTMPAATPCCGSRASCRAPTTCSATTCCWPRSTWTRARRTRPISKSRCGNGGCPTRLAWPCTT